MHRGGARTLGHSVAHVIPEPDGLSLRRHESLIRVNQGRIYVYHLHTRP